MDEQREFDALGYLQAVYRGKIVAETQRMRAAIEALPFEKPKLAVTANLNGHYAAQLEAAMKAEPGHRLRPEGAHRRSRPARVSSALR